MLLNLCLAAVALVTLARFDLGSSWVTAQDRIQRFLAVPPIRSRWPNTLLSPSTTCRRGDIGSGAAPLDAALAERSRRRLGCRVVQGYGMTEMSPVCHAVPADLET